MSRLSFVWRSVLVCVSAITSTLLARDARADDLDDIRARGELRWGADQEGGGPYVYPSSSGDGSVVGFEVDLADAIAKELGVRAVFSQGNWDKLPDLLRVGNVDVVMNGYELTPERRERMEASRAYYVYALQLLVHGDAGWGWTTLQRPANPRRKIGVLTGSAAEELAKKEFGDAVEIVSYDGNTDAMREVANEQIAGTIQDTPIVAFYGPDFPSLLAVGPPRGEGEYVIYARKGETRLIHAIDTALTTLYRRGELRTIYERYRLWNANQARLDTIYASDPPSIADGPATPVDAAPQARPRGFDVVTSNAGLLLTAAGMTLLLAVLSFPLAVLVGALVALGRARGPRWLAPVLGVYVEVLRGTPLLLQLYVLFFLLPAWGFRLPALATAILGLALNYSAYESEILRAGLASVPKGQEEAAHALGLSRWQTLRHVVLPRALRVALPPMANDFIALFKDTSVCSVITIVELTKRYSVLSMSTQATVELTIATAVLYLTMSLPASFAARAIERRFGERARRPAEVPA